MGFYDFYFIYVDWFWFFCNVILYFVMFPFCVFYFLEDGHMDEQHV